MSPKRKQLRLIGYIRVSRVAGRAGDSFQSPGVQRERIEAYASGRGHVLIDVLEEFDESGRNPGRPLFQQALEIVERGDADGIMVARLDRFARSIVDALHAIQRLDAVGGQLIVEDLGLDTTTHGGRLVRNVMLALAEFELERITDNWMTARSHAVARGVQISATPIFGYTRGPDGRLEVDALTAPVVQAIFARRAAGQSLAAITRWLNAEHPSPGRNWIYPSVASMVKSRTYLGEARHGEFVNPDAHPAIVSRVDWEAANGVRPVTVAHSKTMAPALLGGLVRCGGCRYVMPRSAPRKDGGHPRYLCSGRHARGICENRTRVSTALIEPHVETLFVKWLQREGITATGQPTADNDAETATRDLEAADLELAEYRDDTLVSVIGREAYRTGLEKRAQTVEEARERLLATQGAGDFGAVERRRLGEAWPSMPVEAKREILTAAIDAVFVRPGRSGSLADRVRVVWRGDGPADLPRRGHPQPIVPFEFV